MRVKSKTSDQEDNLNAPKDTSAKQQAALSSKSLEKEQKISPKETTVEIPETTDLVPAQKIQYTKSQTLVPGPGILKHFLNQARQEKVNENGETLDQVELDEAYASMLSFEDVLLPSIGHCENHALKQMQKRVQRDLPDQVGIVVAGRVLVGSCIAKAIKAATASRLERHVFDRQREQMWTDERRAKRDENRKARAQAAESRRESEVKKLELQTLKEKREAQKKFLPNQELWREVAFLMTESSKLERECQLWKQAEALLDERENDMETKEKLYAEEKQKQNGPDSMVGEEKENDRDVAAPIEALQRSTEEIMCSSNQIQATLKMVTDLMLDSAKLRKDLYRRYRNDHQFEGYRGVNDPKGLIRILSQDDP